MLCPKCLCLDTQVYDSRIINQNKTIKRRRECNQCHYRFITIEEVKVTDIYIKKRNGQEVAFNKEKLRNSIIKAFNKRKINIDLINKITEQVTEAIIAKTDDTVSSITIGSLALNALRDSDQAAYICYMAMFQNFETAKDFIQLVKQFENNYE